MEIYTQYGSRIKISVAIERDGQIVGVIATRMGDGKTRRYPLSDLRSSKGFREIYDYVCGLEKRIVED